ncbi:MAG TPA: SLC13 family permease [Anaerolineaceae bacterium]|nr:SLC13 family permease [Anaerolineaceae bacterium]
MLSDSILILLFIIIVPLALAAANRLRVDLAALLMATSLGILQALGFGLLGPPGSPKDAIKAISGFSQPVIITLVSLFILTRSLDKSGLTRWLARHLIRLGKNNEGLLVTLLATTTALLSLFMNNLAAGALVLPGAIEVARRSGIPPSKLLIPVAFGSLLGGSATFFTTANIIVSDLLTIANPPQPPLHILDFTPTGGLIAITGILFLGLFGRRLLPDRAPSNEQTLARLTGTELEDIYQLGERLWEAKVTPESPFVRRSLDECGIGHNLGVVVVAIQRERVEISLPPSDQHLLPNDVLLLVGRKEKIDQLQAAGLIVQPARHNGHLSPLGVAFAEVLLAPRSSAEGKSLKEIDFRKRYGLSAVALFRLNRSYRTNVGEMPLQMGDSLLVVGSSDQFKQLKRSPAFLVLEPNPFDQPLDKKAAVISVGMMGLAIAASIAGAPVYLCMLAAAVVTLLLRAVTMEEAYQSIEWQAIFLIAGMYAVSLAMVQTGLARLLGEMMVSAVFPISPLGVAAGAYLLTALLTQVMGGQVAALVTGPITISAAISLGVNPHAVAIATAIGCSASFLTPMAHPVNVLMIAPGNYRFSDFFRVGLPLTLISFAMLLVSLVVFWRL